MSRFDYNLIKKNKSQSFRRESLKKDLKNFEASDQNLENRGFHAKYGRPGVVGPSCHLYHDPLRALTIVNVHNFAM